MHQSEQTPKSILRSDYTPPAYRIESVELTFELDEQATRVHSRLKVSALDATAQQPLRLDGQELELLAIRLDGVALDASAYRIDDESLTLLQPAAHFELELTTRINPCANTALEGLYTSSGNFCTQCEAEGFRKITYYPDRPDVMSVFTTRVIGDKRRYPALLSNGNLVEQGELDDGRHYALWHDPFPKPSYLFALVAGDLACIEDRFTSESGREVLLQIYVQHGNEDKTGHAMRSLKKAMRWDEEVFGREYDLERYMIVAVDDFNMGAMENKGLNVFNSRFVLAKPETATDSDFVGIEAVIAHEYFHNWSGNRVTCRDWFQLSLKEGFTVFRDQQFTADMTSAAVKRIDDVTLLRSRQFPEDSGPMAHPIRPDSYVEINNFYTLTVYEKGAEVVRMLHTLLGGEGFRKGSDCYFDRHDGQAVTCDDFVQAMEDANGIDLSLFRRWYSQSGTPQLSIRGEYDAVAQRYTLIVNQHTPPSADQAEKLPLLIPLRLGLLDSAGNDMPLQLAGEPQAMGTERVIAVSGAEQRFEFTGVREKPTPSLLRGFSAPVKLKTELSDAELAFLMAHDSDEFNRWDASQRLALNVIQRLLDGHVRGERMSLDAGLVEAFGKTLASEGLDPALVAEALTLPGEEYIAEFQELVDPQAIHEVREFVRGTLATHYRAELMAIYDRLGDAGEYHIDALSMGQRRLRNLCLNYLLALDDADIAALALRQYQGASNMTDAQAALTGLVHHGYAEAAQGLADFHARWHNDALVLDKWFAIQAAAPLPQTLDVVNSLSRHADFRLGNPNRARALIATFGMRNPSRFHDPSGEGYRFLAEHIMALNDLNPQVASRLLGPLTFWHRFTPDRQALMRAQLERIAAHPGLSKDVYEVVSKSLALDA